MASKNQIHPARLVTRCLALRRGRYWVAICLDLNLVAQADTLPQVKRLLNAQITSYIADAMTIDAGHAEYLLTRKAALRYRLLYRFAKLVHDTHRRLSFETALPLVPAGA
jgi:hypothetical protein